MKQQREKKEKRVHKARKQIVSLAFFIAAAMTGGLQCAYADKFSEAAKGAATGFQVSAAGAAKWLLVIGMIVMGLVFLIGTQRQKENTKEGIPDKIIGVALIVCAVPIAGIVFGWF